MRGAPVGGQPHGVQDLLVARAAAQVAGERLADLGSSSGCGTRVEQVVHRDDQARRAEAALHRAGLEERAAAPGAAPSLVGEPLDRDDVTALRLPGGDQAGTHGDTVEVDRARPALALLAGVLRAGQPDPLAQHVEQALALPDVVGLPALAVDRGVIRIARRLSLVVVPRPAEGATGQHRQRVQAVGGGAAHVVDRRRRRRRPGRRTGGGASGIAARDCHSPSSASAAGEERLGGARVPRCRRRRADRRPDGLPVRVQGEAERRHRDHHRVAGADLRELLRPGDRRQQHRGDQLVRPERARFTPVKKSATGTCRTPRTDSTSTTASAASSTGCASPAGDADAQVAADRAAHSDLRRPHGARRHGQPGSRRGQLGHHPREADAGTEADAAVVGAGPLAQLRHPGQVDQHVRPVPVEVQLDHHVGAAGDRDRAGVLAARG